MGHCIYRMNSFKPFSQDGGRVAAQVKAPNSESTACSWAMTNSIWAASQVSGAVLRQRRCFPCAARAAWCASCADQIVADLQSTCAEQIMALAAGPIR